MVSSIARPAAPAERRRDATAAALRSLRRAVATVRTHPAGNELADRALADLAAQLALRHFPIVRVLVDADGDRRSALTVDLSATLEDSEPLRITEVVNGARFGISPLEGLS
jgi:hypothetical protein